MLNQIILKINSYLNLNIFNDHLKYFNIDPKLTLINLGFKIIQNRKTKRKIVNAINKSFNHTAFEFVFDTTTYSFGNNKNVTNKELEIELKLSNNIAVLDNFVRKLEINQPLFTFWPYNKLLTGKVIEMLLYNDELKENKDCDEKKILTLAGLEKIELFIKSKRI